MAITYSLGPNPKWYFSDETGKPLGDGYISFYRSLNPSQVKLVYQDIAGNFPWPLVTIPNQGTQKGIQIDENGTQGPFYFSLDDSISDDTYYFEVYDENGILQWTIDNYSPGGSSGGGIITVTRNLENLLLNNVFWRNIGSTPSPIPDLHTVIAPGINTGLALTSSLYGPDICFIKNNFTSTDKIEFLPFALGDTPLTNDVTPEYFCRYTSTGGNSENKYFQIPITKGVKNLSNQILTFTIWARSNSGPSVLTCQIKQFFGDGSFPSVPINIPIDSFNLAGGIWESFTQQVVIPSVGGKIIGECGNDGLFLQIQPPLNSSCNIDFIKPCLYLGDIAPDEDYESYDKINSVIDSPRTADKKITDNNFQFGWVPLDDGTIGQIGSSATNRANTDTFPLYNYIWNNIQREFCPVVGGAGPDAISDFISLKPIFLPKTLGRNISGTVNQKFIQNFTGDFTTNILTIGSIGKMTDGCPVIVNSGIGGVLPSGLVSGRTYYVHVLNSTQVQLAENVFNAINGGPYVSLVSNGTTPNLLIFPPYSLAQYEGKEIKSLISAENGPHTHGVTHVLRGQADPSNGLYPDLQNFKGTVLADDALEITIQSSGNGQPFSILSPTTYSNMFIKL